MVKKKKMGPLLLSGLMIGPILGSGIIILPPLVYEIGGNWAFPAWCFVLLLGFFFAKIFGQLTILFPGDSGVTKAVEYAFGKEVKKLTAFYLIGAVLFGPVAVMLTAAKYLHWNIPLAASACLITVLSSSLLLGRTAFVGKASLVLTSCAAMVLFCGSWITLIPEASAECFVLSEFSADSFGYCMLLLFWTIVGWEVVGNYSADVEKPEQTIMKAIHFSLTAIGVISLGVAAAVQTEALETGEKIQTITFIITPVFGSFSFAMMAFLTCSLCVTTYVMFVGGVARLIAHMSHEQSLPALLGYRLANGSPAVAICCLTLFFCATLGCVYLELVDLLDLVAFADGFFLANAILGLFAAVRLLQKRYLKCAAAGLAIVFLVILFHSSLVVLFIIGMMAVSVVWKNRVKIFSPLFCSLGRKGERKEKNSIM